MNTNLVISDTEAVTVALRESRAEINHLVKDSMTLKQIERGLVELRRMDAVGRAKVMLMEGCLLGVAQRDHFGGKGTAAFMSWAHGQTGLGESTIKRRVSTAEIECGLNLSNITKVQARFGPNGKARTFSEMSQPGLKPVHRGRDYVPDVDAVLKKTRMDRLRDADLDAAREEAEVFKLAQQIVSIGYKVLSKKLHPDAGGNKTAMGRLNEAKKMLLGVCKL